MVRRYTEVFDHNHSQECICHRGPMNRGLEESPEGDFVDIEDYKELKNQLAKANERVRDLEAQLKRLIDYEADQALLPEASSQGTRQLVNDIKNDATDVGGCYEVSCGLLDSLFEHYTDKGASKLLNKFAIEKKIEALRKFEPISNAVANHWCDKEQKGYLWLHAEILAEIENLEQLRKEQGND